MEGIEGMRGGGGKKDFARASLFLALEFVWRVDPLELVTDRIGILVQLPSVRVSGVQPGTHDH